jgi:glycosyltransferase involved in cell wall biosynthesis
VRVVCLAQTLPMLPFGPHSFSPTPAAGTWFQRVSGIVTVSHYMKDYIDHWANAESVVIPYPLLGPGPFPDAGNFDQGFVTMINPSAYKGISIFLELARRLPDVQFAAVPTWATTEADRSELEWLPNVRLLEPVDDIDEIFAQTRVLLVPSLWGEGFGCVATEGMLRGIPVLASDSGGLPEAKLGVDYVLPVRQIECYRDCLDDRGLPEAIVPEQDVEPWLDAILELLSSRTRYSRLSAASRKAALAFVSSIGIEPFIEFLEELASAPQADRGSEMRQEEPAGLAGHLSCEERALLASYLRKR